MIEIIGIITNIAFRNDSTGFTVADIKTEDGSVRATGRLLSCHAGRSYKLTGDISVHPKYGEQFVFEEGEEVLSDTEAGMAAFLSSDLVKGIGPKTAEAIVNKFGKATFDIIENEPERLAEIRGVTLKKAEAVSDAFSAYREFALIEIGLQKYGISPQLAMRLYETYGAVTLDVIEENPYELSDDIDGIGFKRADAIAMKMGMPEDSVERLKSAVRYILGRESSVEGNVYIPESRLYEYMEKLTGAGREAVDDTLISLTFDGRITMDTISGDRAVYLTQLCEAEKRVAGKIRTLNESEPPPVGADIDSLIKEAESDSGITYSGEQKEAIEHSVKNSIAVITGGPGTGKTTIINAIARILKSGGLEVMIAAPTGRAAKRITESTGFEAKTIHRLLEYHYEEGSDRMVFGRNFENPLQCKAVIIDEMSMVDLFLMDALLRALSDGTRLILVGDEDQLPPVGAGNVLRDLIDSGYVPSIELDEIFRQAEESMIVTNAHRINAGVHPEFNGEGSDFFMMNRGSRQEIMDTIADLCLNRLPSYYPDVDMLRDIQVLTPVKKQTVGTVFANTMLQAVLNPAGAEKREKNYGDTLFREGDKVMQIRNDYDLGWKRIDDFSEGEGVFNGDIGFINEINDEDKRVVVVFEDVKYVTYEYSQLDELELAYAITVHKSQGSEFPVVIMPAAPFPPMLATRNLLYTAVTRGKKLVVLVGDKKYINAMTDNDMIKERYSGLGERLTDLMRGDPWSELDI